MSSLLKKYGFITSIMAVVLAFAVVASVQTVSADDDEIEYLTLGFIPSSDAGEIATTAQPLADFLSEELGIEVRAEVMVDYTGLIEAMRTQQVDIGFLAPFSFVQAEERADVEVLLKSVRHGSDTYVAQYVTHVDSGLDSIEDLVEQEGLVWAFPDVLSTSGYLFPAAQLSEMGIEDLDRHFDQLAVGGHDNAIIQVYDGQADFATTFDDARGNVEEELEDVMDVLQVIGTTDEIPNDTISVRSELPDDLKEQIKEAFLSLNENEEMLEIMNEIYNWDGLAEASSEDYDIVREVFSMFEDELTEDEDEEEDEDDSEDDEDDVEDADDVEDEDDEDDEDDA